MLGITATNQTASSNNIGYCSYETSDSCSSSSTSARGVGFGSSAGMMLDDDMMDPLFDEDWLHEHNLDILFDLFEEEIESKCVESNNGSNSLFGTSPVTSYLFGTSPSLASALDLLCFDNHQPQQTIPNNAATQSQNCNLLNNNSIGLTNNQQRIDPVNNLDHNNNRNNVTAPLNIINNDSTQQAYQHTSTSSTANFNISGGTINNNYINNSSGNARNNCSSSITQAMRIKRGLKKGQSEGTSLLARPLASSNNGKVNINNNDANHNINNTKNASNTTNGSTTNTIAKTIKFSTINGRSSNGNNKLIVSTNNNRDKASAKITNFKNSILGKNDNNKVTNGVEIAYSKQSHNYRYLKQNCQNHVHYITGRAVIREHAYAVRGH